MLNIGLGLLDSVIEISKRAGAEILKVYNTEFKIEVKDDQSPVTAADKIAEALILRSIKEGISQKFPIISEEAASNGGLPEIGSAPFWLVDPLDGTKEFVNRNGEFTVNIALIENTKPVLGVVYVPTKDIVFWGSTHGSFVKKAEAPPEKLTCEPFPKKNIKVAVSRSHYDKQVDTFLKNFDVKEKISAGSSLKFCLVAEGLVDLYPRFGRTMEWDTAAGHAILHFAGGMVKTLENCDLIYGKSTLENPNFVASGPGLSNFENFWQK